MQWLNEPPEWSGENDRILVTTAPRTDFWRTTHYGHVSDNGHFYHQKARGEFTAQVAFSASYVHRYDQAGLMVRLDDRNWIKAGIEFFNDALHLSTVVTREFSDWSTQRLENPTSEVWIRLTRSRDSVVIEYSLDSNLFQLMRLAYFPVPTTCQIGMMACSPEGSGLRVEFSDFKLNDPVQTAV